MSEHFSADEKNMSIFVYEYICNIYTIYADVYICVYLYMCVYTCIGIDVCVAHAGDIPPQMRERGVGLLEASPLFLHCHQPYLVPTFLPTTLTIALPSHAMQCNAMQWK